jgi:cephalosporin hydroxylase
MNHITRLKIARLVRFVRPPASVIPLSIEQVLDNWHALSISEQFNKLYYESGVAGSLHWRGIPMLKNPCDLWMMLELLQSVRPSVLIETGTHHGGSALYFSEMMTLLGSPIRIITIDINPKWHVDPESFGIDSIVGFSTDRRVKEQVRNAVDRALSLRSGPVMVTLDSDHSEENVTQELQLYSPFVTQNSYLIVEDTNVNGHPSAQDHGPGPWEAVEKFLAAHAGFVRDRGCERHLLTFFPGGWLKRVQ